MKKTKCIVIVIAVVTIFSALLSACVTEDKKVTETEATAVAKEVGTKLVAGTEYIASEMLYYSPDDSDGTILQPGMYYKIGTYGGIDIVDALSGEVIESYCGDSKYTEINEDEWKSLFTEGLTVDISSYDEKLQYNASDNYRFYLMDDEVWLGTIKDENLISLFKMSENTMK